MNQEKLLFIMSSFFVVCQCDLQKDSKVGDNLGFKSVHHLMTDPEKLLLFGHESRGPEYEIFEPTNWSKIRSNLQYLNLKKQKLKIHLLSSANQSINEEEDGKNNNSDHKKEERKKRRRRRKRSYAYINYRSDKNQPNQRIKEYPSKLRIKFTAFNQQFDLILKQNDNLFSKDSFLLQEEEEGENWFQNNSHTFNGSKSRNESKNSDKFQSRNDNQKIQLTNCYYQGYCMLHSNSSAAISMCEGMRGLIETKEAIYVVNPLPNGVIRKFKEINGNESRSSSHPHVIVKKEPNDGYNCPHRRSSQATVNLTTPEATAQSSSLLYSDLVDSVLKDQTSYIQTLLLRNKSDTQTMRIKRSLSSNTFPENDADDGDSDSIGSSKVGVTVETAVFVDETLYEIMRRTYPVDTEQEIVTYILTIMNAVQLLFKQASLGRDVSISVILMDILKTQPRDLISSDNIDTYLTNFCVWQHNKRINSRGLTPRWDHALLLSGINMYVVDGQGRKKRHVVGLAPVSGMCNSLNSCTISEGTSFQTVLVAGHEMGHSLGMEHDGPQDGNSCDQNDFIMSPTLGAGKTSWSTCSKRYLDKFLKTNQASCVLGTSSHVNILHQFATQNKLPGQIFDSNQQCALRFGSDSKRSSIQSVADICRLLRCDTGSKRNTIVYHAHPALEGTSCGQNKWCREGSCIDMDPDPRREIVMHATASDLNSIEKKKGEESEVIDGRWSSWSSWTPCSSECIIRSSDNSDLTIVGISWSTRKCNSPSPFNGGKLCDGNDKMVKLCDASQLCLSSPVYKMVTTSEYIDDVCRVASKRDTNLEPRGTQYPSYDRSHSCYVWCHKKGGGFMTQGWKLPDGTPCGRETYSRSLLPANRFCVNGECRPFDCDGINNDKSPTEVCPVPFSAVSQPLESRSSEKTVMKSTSVWSPWIPLTSCHFPCLVKGRGIQLITRECNSIGSCHGMRDWFQLCPKSEDTCLPSKIKTADDYANDLCHKYRYRYPTLLSGRGRQLSPRNGNLNSACIVACQDRVWMDIHYQMDAFEDGKFPLGTDCSSPSSRSGDNSRKSHQAAYCVDGRCIKFDEADFPVETNVETITHVKSFISREFRYLNRHRRSTPNNNPIVHKKAPIQDTQFYGERIVPLSNRGIPNWKPVRSSRPARFEPPIEESSNSSNVLRLQTYSWGMTISDCSSPCGTGHQIIRVYCHSGHAIVDDKLCSEIPKPIESGLRACNQHNCTGGWRVEKWSQCSTSCGSGFRTRAVICVHKTEHDNIFSLKDSQCSRRDQPSTFESCNNNCTLNHHRIGTRN